MSTNKSQVNLENQNIVQQKAEVVKKALSELIATKYKTAIKTQPRAPAPAPQTTYLNEQPQRSPLNSDPIVRSEIKPRVPYIQLHFKLKNKFQLIS